jgi:hypothetical protein
MQKQKDIFERLCDHFLWRGIVSCLTFGVIAGILTWAVSAACGLSAPVARALGIAEVAFVTVACVGAFRVETRREREDNVLNIAGSLARFVWCLMTPPLLVALLVSPQIFGLPDSASIVLSSSSGYVGSDLEMGDNLWTDYPVKVSALFALALAAIWVTGVAIVRITAWLLRAICWSARSIWNVEED